MDKAALFASAPVPVDGFDGLFARSAPADPALMQKLIEGDYSANHRAVELGIVDTDGARVFSDGEAQRLPMATFLRLARAVNEANGDLSEAAVQDAEGN